MAAAPRGRPALLACPVSSSAVQGDWSGPGSGHRRYPKDLGQQVERPAERGRAQFQCKTTEQCYSEFPYLVHISMPLRVDDREPAGLSAEHLPDAGPATGLRRRPPPVDPEAVRRPAPLPHPALAGRDMRREVLLRHRIALD